MAAAAASSLAAQLNYAPPWQRTAPSCVRSGIRGQGQVVGNGHGRDGGGLVAAAGSPLAAQGSRVGPMKRRSPAPYCICEWVKGRMFVQMREWGERVVHRCGGELRGRDGCVHLLRDPAACESGAVQHTLRSDGAVLADAGTGVYGNDSLLLPDRTTASAAAVATRTWA